MFLTEGTRLNSGSRINASPTTGWQMLYESEVIWHKLEMGMTRLEHSAIVREDHGLLQEGVKEFFTKAKRWFQWAGQEFLRYLDKVIDTWINIQNKIKTWLTDFDAMKRKIMNAKGGKGINVGQWQVAAVQIGIFIAQNSDKLKSKVDKMRDAADKHDSDNDDFGSAAYEAHKENGRESGANLLAKELGLSNKVFDQMNNNYDEVKIMDEKTLMEFVNFARDGRARCIKTLQYCRNSIAKLINSGIRAADSESEEVKSIKHASSKVREILNRYISLINKATNAVISALGKLKDAEALKNLSNRKNVTMPNVFSFD